MKTSPRLNEKRLQVQKGALKRAGWRKRRVHCQVAAGGGHRWQQKLTKKSNETPKGKINSKKPQRGKTKQEREKPRGERSPE
jgi:hypothetical protein